MIINRIGFELERNITSMIKVTTKGSKDKMLEYTYNSILRAYETVYRKWYKTPFSWVKNSYHVAAALSIYFLVYMIALIVTTCSDFARYSVCFILSLLIGCVISSIAECLFFHFIERKQFLEDWKSMKSMTWAQYVDHVSAHPDDADLEWEAAVTIISNMDLLCSAKILGVARKDESDIEVAYADEDNNVQRILFCDVTYAEKAEKCDTVITLDIDDTGAYKITCIAPYDGRTSLVDYSAVEDSQEELK